MNIKLTDLIDVKTLQEIQDGFAATTGMAALTTDEKGNALTKGSNFTDFCMNLTRKSPAGCKRCEQCDADGGKQALRMGKAVAYRCHGGLYDFAAPIMLNGEMIGSFIGGQVLPEKPDENAFRKIAKELGIDPEAYVRAVRKVPVLPKERIDAAASFLYTIAKTLSNAAYSAYVAKQSNIDLSSGNLELRRKLSETAEVVQQSIQNMRRLGEKFEELETAASSSAAEVNATRDTIKVIKDIAMNTRILGFNASIEASRAKESGKGFGVIAQEVRGLAETSTVSADKIEVTMKSITDSTKKIDECVKETRKVVEENLQNMAEFEDLLKDFNK